MSERLYYDDVAKFIHRNRGEIFERVSHENYVTVRARFPETIKIDMPENVDVSYAESYVVFDIDYSTPEF
jgi:hypothetical protein